VEGGIDNCPTELYSGDNGVRFGIKVMLPMDVSIPMDKDGKGWRLRMEAYNSVDGSQSFKFMMGLWKLICSNGAGIWHGRFCVTQRHTASLADVNLNIICGEALVDVKNVVKRMERWGGIQIDKEKRDVVNLELRNHFGSTANRVGRIYDEGKDPSLSRMVVPGLSPDRTAYRLYNALTWVGSRMPNAIDSAKTLSKVEEFMGATFRN
jgi:hypothetical protein